jgi:hypothetical protein
MKAKEGEKIDETFHQEREKIYLKEFLAEERDKDFQYLYEKYFSDLGFKAIFAEIIGEFPLLSDPNVLIFVKRVCSRKQEESELFLQGDFKTVYIGLQVVRILDQSFLKDFLRHELMHVSDMLDSKFQYLPNPVLRGKGEIENNFIRDRFRVLWNLYVDARLKRKRHLAGTSEEKQRREFEKLFSFWDESRRGEVLKRIAVSENITQADLLMMASDQRLSKTLGEGGLRCPLCDFTSYEVNRKWTKEEILVAQEIRKNHPWWEMSMGVCTQCFDIYQSKLRIGV